MAIVQRSVQIKASPTETMALLSDASRWPDWYPGMTKIDIAAPFPEKGGKVTFKVKSAGLSMPITETVLEYRPDGSSSFKWKACCREALAGRSLRTVAEHD
jgi:hypothetical protein